jgi:ATP-binding cassette subfamily C (CFTR/MRP) protein 1
MAVYAGLGVGTAIFAFIGWYSVFLSGIGASLLIAQKALGAVLRSPVSFHDRTPSGRIISRLTKDVELMDEFMVRHYHWVFLYILSIIGSIVLVCYAYGYLGVIFIPMAYIYCMMGVFYGRTTRQTRRINATMRSFVYSAFGEQLSGMLTIRAFRRQQSFTDAFSSTIDNEARFYYTTTFASIWLSLRLDLLASMLIMGIGIFGVGFRNSVSPAKLSVVLTYTLQTAQARTHTLRVRGDSTNRRLLPSDIQRARHDVYPLRKR